ncbi:hypothetical protein DPMN_014534 [Dreissena polymorpha]|uniref:Uncharacterized protein n=1 Tax=Dreissena polymorpha TaxID=45954 RepID=A0A9D4N9J3_DREPO|nr:hypothetical protein DPMN_014534 [Dreissena polymorpha]
MREATDSPQPLCELNYTFDCLLSPPGFGWKSAPSWQDTSNSPYRRHGSHVRLSASGPTSSSPVRTACVYFCWPGVYSTGTTASRFGSRTSCLCKWNLLIY